jgi:hypothetical protein
MSFLLPYWARVSKILGMFMGVTFSSVSIPYVITALPIVIGIVSQSSKNSCLHIRIVSAGFLTTCAGLLSR